MPAGPTARAWPEDQLLFCYAQELLPAYGWLFPLGAGAANVGVGSFLGESRASHLGPAFVNFQGWLQRAGILGPASLLSETGTDLLRTGMRGNTLVAERMIAVGDAAGAIDPLSGEGVSQALRSGRLAAQAATLALAAGDLSAEGLRGYRGALRQALGKRSRQARWTRRLLRSSRLIDTLVRVVGRRPDVANQLYEMLVGEQDPFPTVWSAGLAMVRGGGRGRSAPTSTPGHSG